MAAPLYSQQDTLAYHRDNPADTAIYYVNPWLSAGLTVLGTWTNSAGLKRVHGKPTLTRDDFDRLQNAPVPRIDRISLRQRIDRVEESEQISDYFFNGAVLLPFTLFLDQKIRQDWRDITLMYLETQTLASNFYSYGPIGPSFVDRYRPRAYYLDIDEDRRNTGNMRNSFFSGHVSTVAVGTFYTVKIFSDYHPEFSGGIRLLLYGLAAIPPAITAVYRVRALKHWPTDTVIGGLVGAGFALLLPELHKLWQRRRYGSRLSLSPIYGTGVKGLSMRLSF